MPEEITLEKAKEMLEEYTQKAQEIIQDPSKISDLLQSLEEKLAGVPYAGTGLAKVPLMIDMVRSYITKEYTAVSPKVIATMVGSFLYLVTGNDLIPDKIPVVGQLDDIAVFALALGFTTPELDAYAAWRKEKDGVQTV